MQDRQIQREEAAAHKAVADQKLEKLTHRLSQTEAALQSTAKNFILSRPPLTSFLECFCTYIRQSGLLLFHHVHSGKTSCRI